MAAETANKGAASRPRRVGEVFDAFAFLFIPYTTLSFTLKAKLLFGQRFQGTHGNLVLQAGREIVFPLFLR